MKKIEVLFLGSGDAFGSGGRLQSCVMVKHESGRFLIDCGTTCLIGMNRYGVNPNDIDLILISHLHGDHYGGIPFLINASQLVYKRTNPLLIIGPPGMKELLAQAMDAMFPGSANVQRKFAVEVREYSDRTEETIRRLKFTPYLNFNPQADASFALRIVCDGKVIAYSGDTEWNDALLKAAARADVFVSEAYFYEKKIKGHMDYVTLMSRHRDTEAKRLLVMHMSHDMLEYCKSLPCECADDGKTYMV